MSQLNESFHIAFNNLSHNAVRSLLSVLGVVIGIAAVITVLSIGAGAKQRIMEQINSMGVSIYTVSAGYDEKTRRMGTMDFEDVRRIQSIPAVLSAIPQLNLYKNIRSRSAESYGVIMGVDAGTLKAKSRTLSRGRNFSPIEVESRASLCLISEAAEQTLFGGDVSAVGQSIFIEENPWQVIGVIADITRSKSGEGNIEVWAPIDTLLRNSKDVSIRQIEAHVKTEGSAGIELELLRCMERDDPNRKGLFTVRDQKELYARTIEIQNTLSLIGALVACVSLIVGGIGMMNVMLTSVAERTREIGIRRAVGARKKDILFQFLVESCLLSLMGGILGLLLGAACARGLPIMFKEFFTVAPVMQPSFLVFSVTAGIVLGVVFGFYPAIKASKLSPSEARRTE